MRHAASALFALLTLLAPPAALAQVDMPAPPAAAASAAAAGTADAADNAASADAQARAVFLVLVGEIAAETGQPQLASRELLLAAQTTQSPALYERATEVAVAAGLGQQALDAVAGWRQLEPDAIKPLAWQAKLQLELHHDTAAAAAIARLLQLTPPAQRGPAVLSLLQTFEHAADPQQALLLARKSLADTDDLPQTWLVLGELEMRAGDAAGAFDHARRTLAADSTSLAAAALLLQNYRVDPQQADALLRPYFEQRPDAGDLRLAWIGAALDQQRGGVALEQAQKLTQQQPELAEGWLFLGSVQLQQAQAAAAAQSLHAYFNLPGDKPPRGRAMAALGLSQAELKLGHIDQAERWLKRVAPGYDDQSVAFQTALIQVGRKQAGQAQATLERLPGATPQQRRERLLALARLEHEQGHDARAWGLLESGLDGFGDDTDFLYEAALAAERAGHPATMEKLLRRAVARDPHDASVLNALGYTLADQNRNLDEAANLIGQAVRLSPGNPFMLDSQGWLQFRQGRLQQARQTLESALAAQPDPEIQAHLAEVLWASGERQQATELLRAALQQSPQDRSVRDAIKRLGLRF